MNVQDRLHEETWEYRYPVADCPLCHEQDSIFGIAFFREDMMQKKIIFCLNCTEISDNVDIKGYVSYLDLEELDMLDNL